MRVGKVLRCLGGGSHHQQLQQLLLPTSWRGRHLMMAGCCGWAASMSPQHAGTAAGSLFKHGAAEWPCG